MPTLVKATDDLVKVGTTLKKLLVEMDTSKVDINKGDKFDDSGKTATLDWSGTVVEVDKKTNSISLIGRRSLTPVKQ
jgi:hypothetical protein